MLAEEQIELLRQRILQGGVRNKTLQDDLLDHYCCSIETAINEGQDFEAAYREAYKTITPDGMHDIETEYFLLLTLNKQIGMKRLIYSFGFLTATSYLIALILSVMRSSVFYIESVVARVLLLITLLLISIDAAKRFKSYSLLYKLRILAGLVAGGLEAVGSILQIRAYPQGSPYIVAGLLIFSFLFLPLYFSQQHKKAVLAFVGCALFSLGTGLSIVEAYAGAGIFMALGIISFAVYAFMVLSRSLKIFDSISFAVRSRIIIGNITAAVLFVAAITLLFHWDWGKYVGVTGIAMLALIFLPMYFYQSYRKNLPDISK